MLENALRPLTNSHELTEVAHRAHDLAVLAAAHPGLTWPLAVAAVLGGLTLRPTSEAA